MKPRIKTGIESLDVALGGGLEPGLHVVAGPCSSGKSSLEGTIMTAISGRGVATARACLNMTMSNVLNRDVSRHSDVALSNLNTGKATKDELKKAYEASKEICNWPMFMMEKDWDQEVVCKWIRKRFFIEKIVAASVDNLSNCILMDDDLLGDHLALANNSAKQLHALGVDLGIPILGTEADSPVDPKLKVECASTIMIGTIRPSRGVRGWKVYLDVLRGGEVIPLELWFQADRFMFRDLNEEDEVNLK